MATESRSLRLFAEFVVIVAGVLIALAFDEWRQTLQDQELEEQYVARLIVDLEADQAEFERTDRSFVSTSIQAQGLLEWLRGEHPDWSPEAVVATAHFATRMQSPDPVVGAYEELVSTGRLGLLSEPDLRGALAFYYSRLEARRGFFENREPQLVDFVSRRLSPAARSMIVAECVAAAALGSPVATISVPSASAPGECSPQLPDTVASSFVSSLRSQPNLRLDVTGLLTDLETASSFTRWLGDGREAALAALGEAQERP